MTDFSKLENIWYLHKFKIIVIFAIIATAMIIFFINNSDIESDIDIAYMSGGWTVTAENQAYATGGWYIDEEKQRELEDFISLNIQDVNNDKKRQALIYPLGGPMSVDLDILSEGSQVMLLNIDILKEYMPTGAFEPLDSYIDKYGINITGNPEVITIVEGMTEGHTYAIPVTNMPHLRKAGFPPKEYYYTIRVVNEGNSKLAAKNQNAHLLLDALLGSNRDGTAGE